MCALGNHANGARAMHYHRRGGLRFIKIGRLNIQWSISKPKARVMPAILNLNQSRYPMPAIIDDVTFEALHHFDNEDGYCWQRWIKSQ
jgi:hypothetical protein